MNKSEKLEMLDRLVIDKMIAYIQDGEINLLSELTTAVQYLKANQVVAPPKKYDSDPVEARKKKLEEAKARRGE